MSQHDILFSITEDGRDGINFQIHGSEIENILNQKEEVLEVLERLKKALVNETYPFTRPLLRPALKAKLDLDKPTKKNAPKGGA